MKLGFVVALAGLAMAVGMTSCGAEPGRFYIIQNQVPAEGCVIPTAREQYRGEGILDVALVPGDASVGYRFFPLVTNEFPKSGESGSAEPNRLILRSFQVKVEVVEAPKAVSDLMSRLQSSADRLVDYEEPWSGTLDPGGGVVSAGVTIFPGELARRIRETKALEGTAYMRAQVRVRAVGERRIGTLQSDEFIYPLRICHGCLVASSGPCPAATAGAKGNQCNIAQDQPVDCCVLGDRLVCPAAVESGK